MTTVYTTPNCVQCNQTKKYLDRENVPYTTVDLTQDQEAMDMITGLGFKSVPVVITETDKWAGFKLDKLSALVA
jgi:glutaredoxin-like protein NrdH